MGWDGNRASMVDVDGVDGWHGIKHREAFAAASLQLHCSIPIPRFSMVDVDGMALSIESGWMVWWMDGIEHRWDGWDVLYRRGFHSDSSILNSILDSQFHPRFLDSLLSVKPRP